MKKKYGFIIGIILGLFLDFFIGKNLGTNAIMLGVVGLLGARLDKSFSKENRMTLMLMMSFSTLVGEAIYFILQVIQGLQIELVYFLKILVVEIIYNALLTIILYPVMQKFGGIIEEDFADSKTFIKYF